MVLLGICFSGVLQTRLDVFISLYKSFVEKLNVVVKRLEIMIMNVSSITMKYVTQLIT